MLDLWAEVNHVLYHRPDTMNLLARPTQNQTENFGLRPSEFCLNKAADHFAGKGAAAGAVPTPQKLAWRKTQPYAAASTTRG